MSQVETEAWVRTESLLEIGSLGEIVSEPQDELVPERREIWEQRAVELLSRVLVSF